MRILLGCFLVVCLIGISQGKFGDWEEILCFNLDILVSAYHCYECNSTLDENCFDFSLKTGYYKAVDCDFGARGQENCYSVQISGKNIIFQ